MQRPQATHFVFPCSSFSKYWIPLQRFAGATFSSGYWMVIGLEKNRPSVRARPLSNGMIIFNLFKLQSKFYNRFSNSNYQ
jgi:hypothetical protein